MVSQESIKKALKSLNEWERRNPHARVRDKIKRSGIAIKEFTEMDVRLATLPSIFVPTPDYIIKKIDKRIKGLK